MEKGQQKLAVKEKKASLERRNIVKMATGNSIGRKMKGGAPNHAKYIQKEKI